MLNKDMIDTIKELQNLKETEILTEKEFEREKCQILAYNNTGIRWLTAFTDFLKVGIWPFIALFVVVTFYAPLKDRLSKSVELKVGSFSMKVQETATISGSAELATI